MTDGAVPLTVADGLGVRSVTLRVPRFTLIAATTEEGDLPRALHSRFALREHLGWYEKEALAEIAFQAAARQGVLLSWGAGEALADAARGTPREVLRLLERTLDHVAAACGDGPAACQVSAGQVRETLAGLGYDAQGLHPDEQRYLALLQGQRRPVSLALLARGLGLPVRTVVEHLEPRLVLGGLVRVTPQGRQRVERGGVPWRGYLRGGAEPSRNGASGR
jgi:Holliday junction DNA helicase RuvB